MNIRSTTIACEQCGEVQITPDGVLACSCTEAPEEVIRMHAMLPAAWNVIEPKPVSA